MTMTKTTKSTIEVQGISIVVLTERKEDFISLTDMLKGTRSTSNGWHKCRSFVKPRRDERKLPIGN